MQQDEQHKLTAALMEIREVVADRTGMPPEKDFPAWIIWQEKKLVDITWIVREALDK